MEKKQGMGRDPWVQRTTISSGYNSWGLKLAVRNVRYACVFTIP
jgi:hypothetical protein